VRRDAKIAVCIVAAIGVVAIAASLLGPFVTDCSTQRISSVISPSGGKKAEHFETRCKSEGMQTSEIHLVQNGVRTRTEIGRSTQDRIGLAWEDEHSLVISVPPGMKNAFDRPMQGVELKFQVVDEDDAPPL
jgi:hypothetical protein